MQSVLFQTDKPTAASGRVEFYELCLSQQDVEGQPLSLVQEIHGWWDNEHQQAFVDETGLAPTETFSSFGQALDHFSRQRAVRASSGFTHSFRWHPISGVPAYHRPIESSLFSHSGIRDRKALVLFD